MPRFEPLAQLCHIDAGTQPVDDSRNAQSSIAGHPRAGAACVTRVTTEPLAALEVQRFGNYNALVFGINEYQFWPKLSFAEGDADGIAGLLPMSQITSDTDIDRIGLGVLQRSLPKSEWTHAAHFAAAFWLLRHPSLDAFRDLPGLIRTYNEATGVPNTDSSGYHETITLASLRAARAWLATHCDQPLWQALQSLLVSQYGKSDWLLTYWSKPLLFSTTARRTWMEPDLRPLPF